MGIKISNVSGWVKRSVIESLDPVVQKKVADAIKKELLHQQETQASSN